MIVLPVIINAPFYHIRKKNKKATTNNPYGCTSEDTNQGDNKAMLEAKELGKTEELNYCDSDTEYKFFHRKASVESFESSKL